MRVMILAAGRGERMGALTSERPKPLVEIDGEPLLGRLLRRLAAAGLNEAVINLSYRGDQIRAAVGDGSRYGVRVAWSQEPEPPLGTAGGIVQALPLLGPRPFLLVNADVVCDVDVSGLEAGPEQASWQRARHPGRQRHDDKARGCECGNEDTLRRHLSSVSP